jgi:hypothetical protein
MIRKTAAALTALLALGCQDPSDRCELTESCPKPDLAVPDLAAAPPKCAAAKGLTGDALICVDFDQPTTTLADLMTKGWNFVNAPLHPWEIANGKLQVNNFATFADTGSFRLPLTDLATAPNQKYQSVTLAVVQRVDLNSNPAVQQKAQPFLGLADPFRQIDFTTGSNPRQQKVYSLTRTDLATVSGVGTNFQPLFQLTSPVAAPGNTGWQIESIAVMGNP